jgi:hypothetical protein
MAAHGFSNLTVRTGGGLKLPKGPRRPTTPDPSHGRGTIPTQAPARPKVKPKVAKRNAAIDYVQKRQAKRGNVLTHKQAAVRVKKNIRSDSKDRAYKYDFAGDGAGKKDIDYGSKANNAARKKHGYKPVKKQNSHNSHAGGNGNKGDKGTTANDPGNSQSGDSYGGAQSPATQLQSDHGKKGYKKVNGKWVRK